MAHFRALVGLFLLSLVVVIWVASSNVLSYLFTGDFNNPFATTYFNTSLFTCYLIGFARPKWRSRWDRPVLPYLRSLLTCRIHLWDSLESHLPENEAVSLLPAQQQSEEEPVGEPVEPVAMQVSVLEVARLSFLFCPIWFLANYTFNLSLGLTTVASNTIISNTSSFFTLIIGALFRVDSFTWWKLLGVIGCLGGVVIVALTDNALGRGSTAVTDSLVGDIVALFSALCYAFYTVLLKLRIDEEKVSMPMFFGFVGLFNCVFLWPIGFVLNATGFEVFSLPSLSVFALLITNAFIGTVLSDLLWLYSILLTSPLIGTLGLSLTIPLALLWDFLAKNASFSLFYLLGSALVLLSFLSVTLLSSTEFTSYLKSVYQRKSFISVMILRVK